MGMFRPSRDAQDHARSTLLYRIAVFVIGAILAVIGIATGVDWLLYIAVGVLVVGVVLRVVRSRPN